MVNDEDCQSPFYMLSANVKDSWIKLFDEQSSG
jgi:hypothetical protein